jgi:hypothetical protein
MPSTTRVYWAKAGTPVADDPLVARPAWDVEPSGWQTDDATFSEYYTYLDDINDTDYVESPIFPMPVIDRFEIAFEPSANAAGYDVSYRLAKATSDPLDVTVALMQGQVQIAEWQHALTTTPTTYTQTLTSGQAAAITNVKDLRLRVDPESGRYSHINRLFKTSVDPTGGGLQTITLSKPTSAAVGDLVFMFYWSGNQGVVTVPEGWNLFGQRQQPGSFSWLRVYWKTMTENEPSSWSWLLATTVTVTFAAAVYRGLGDAVVDVTNTGFANSATQVVTPGVTTTDKGELLFHFVGHDGSRVLSSNDMTLREAGGNPGVWLFDEYLPNAGATGSRQLTVSSLSNFGSVIGAMKRDLDPPQFLVPEFVGSAIELVAATSITVDVPDTTEDGQFMIALITMSTGGGEATLGYPAGWNLIRQGVISTSNVKVGLAYRIADSEPATYTFTSSITGSFGAGIAVYNNIDIADPIDTFSYREATNPIVFPNSLFVEQPNTLLLHCPAGAGGRSLSDLGPYTKRLGSGIHAGGNILEYVMPTGGSSGSPTVTASANWLYGTHLVAVRPAGA